VRHAVDGGQLVTVDDPVIDVEDIEHASHQRRRACRQNASVAYGFAFAREPYTALRIAGAS